MKPCLEVHSLPLLLLFIPSPIAPEGASSWCESLASGCLSRTLTARGRGDGYWESGATCASAAHSARARCSYTPSETPAPTPWVATTMSRRGSGKVSRTTLALDTTMHGLEPTFEQLIHQVWGSKYDIPLIAHTECLTFQKVTLRMRVEVQKINFKTSNVPKHPTVGWEVRTHTRMINCWRCH